MKKIFWIVLALSVTANIYFAWDKYQLYQERQRFMTLFNVREISLPLASAKFLNKLKEKYPNLPAKKYYYLNVWNTMCKPCIEEMPYLDSLAGTYKDKDIAFVFVTDDPEEIALPFIEKKGLKLEHSYQMTDAIEIISGIMTSQKTKQKVYPMHVIITNDGQLLHYHIGAQKGKNTILETALKGIKAL